MVVVGVAGAFALGFYLPSLVFTAVSSFLVALVPDSGGLDVEIPFMFQLALGASLGTAALIGLVRPSQGERAWRKGPPASGAWGGRSIGYLAPAYEPSTTGRCLARRRTSTMWR